MRIFILKQGHSLQSLAKSLEGHKSGGAAIERVKALNPHVDFSRMEPGTVLLLPDELDDGESVAGSTIQGVGDEIRHGLKLSSARVRKGLAHAEEQRKEVSAVLKGGAFKKASGGDAELKEQAAAVEARFKSTQTSAKETEERLAALDLSISAGLVALKKLIG